MRWKPSFLLAGVAMILLCGCSLSPEATEAKDLARGKEAFQRKNYATAILYFKKAAQAQPDDAEPHYQLGLVDLEARDFRAAAQSFQKAVELDPKHTDAQLKLAEMMSQSNSKAVVEDAQKRTLEVLNALPDSVDALDVLAVTELRLGEPESAETHLEAALRKSPGQLESSVDLAQARLAQKDVAGAEEALKQAVAQAPKSPDPSVYLGRFYLSQGKTADAEQQFRHALQIDPKSGPALLALGAMQVRAGQGAQAEQTYRQVAALPERRYKPAHALYLFQSGKRDLALTEFEKLAHDDPADRNLRRMLVEAYLSLNRMGDAEKYLTGAVKKNGRDADALLQRSRIYLASGRDGEAQADLKQVLSVQANSAEAHYLLAKVEQARSDVTLQSHELDEALRLDPNYAAARIERARTMIAGGDAQSALQLLDQASESQKETVPVVVERTWALMALGRNAEARKAVDQTLAKGKVADALLQDAILKLNQKDYPGARASAEGALDLSPEDTRALNALVQSYALQNQLPMGVEKVRERAAREPASARVQEFLGQLLLATGDRPGARKAFEAAKAASPGLVSADILLANLDASEGQRDAARKRFAAIVAAHPNNVAAHVLWAQLESADGKAAASIGEYRKVLTLDPKNVAALNNLAYELEESKQFDEALKYAQQAKDLSAENPAIDDTLGWIYYQKGMYALAESQLGSAVAKKGTATSNYHLAMACLKAGDPKRGRQALDAALKMNPNLPEAQAANQLFGNSGK